jgi:hypothetical protein
MVPSEAKKALLKKFTNYRRTRANKEDADVDEKPEVRTAETAAAALCDLKKFTNGKAAFIVSKQDAINSLRSKLVAETGCKPIAAYQKAVKKLWDDEEDHNFWELQSKGDIKDITTFLFLFLLPSKIISEFVVQKSTGFREKPVHQLGRHLPKRRTGSHRNPRLYAFRGEDGKVDVGA